MADDDTVEESFDSEELDDDFEGEPDLVEDLAVDDPPVETDDDDAVVEEIAPEPVPEPAKAKGKAKTPKARKSDDDDDDDDDEEDPDDVEADLDTILKDRIAAPPEEEDENEQPEPDERGDGTGRVQPKKPGEFVCQSCFLVKHPSQLADDDLKLCTDCV